MHFDLRYKRIRDEINVLHAAVSRIEYSIDPDTARVTVGNSEYRTLDITGGSGVDEFGIPVFACPNAFSFRSEQRCCDLQRSLNVEFKFIMNADHGFR